MEEASDGEQLLFMMCLPDPPWTALDEPHIYEDFLFKSISDHLQHLFKVNFERLDDLYITYSTYEYHVNLTTDTFVSNFKFNRHLLRDIFPSRFRDSFFDNIVIVGSLNHTAIKMSFYRREIIFRVKSQSCIDFVVDYFKKPDNFSETVRAFLKIVDIETIFFRIDETYHCLLRNPVSLQEKCLQVAMRNGVNFPPGLQHRYETDKVHDFYTFIGIEYNEPTVSFIKTYDTEPFLSFINAFYTEPDFLLLNSYSCRIKICEEMRANMTR